jgi:hypothetical protein
VVQNTSKSVPKIIKHVTDFTDSTDQLIFIIRGIPEIRGASYSDESAKPAYCEINAHLCLFSGHS